MYSLLIGCYSTVNNTPKDVLTLKGHFKMHLDPTLHLKDETECENSQCTEMNTTKTSQPYQLRIHNTLKNQLIIFSVFNI